MELLSYYTTCENCEDLTGVATVLEGVGQYDRPGDTLYGADCPGCGADVAISGWLNDDEEED